MSRICGPGVKHHRAQRDLRAESLAAASHPLPRRWAFNVGYFTLCTILLFLTPAVFTAHATSRFYSTLDELIERSDVIAVVTIKNTDEKNRTPVTSGRAPGFACPAQIKIALKGQPSGEIVIHHGAALDDHLFQQGPGEYVVFLKMKKGQLTTTDGWPSSKFVFADRVAGWSDQHDYVKDFATLPEVITAIKAKVSP